MNSLKHIYIALIRSTFDYACITFSSAAKSHLQKLDLVQTQALRLCSGAFKTSSIPALQVEVGEMPLSLRRLQLAMVYWVNLQGHKQDHPTKPVLNACWEHGRKQLNSFGWVGNNQAEKLGIAELNHSSTVALSAIPPWVFPLPIVDLEISKILKQYKEYGVINDVVKQYLGINYNNSIQIFTDGSKDPSTGKTGAAVYVPHFQKSILKRTSDHLAVYTVELLAILLALTWIEEVGHNQYVICSDSGIINMLYVQTQWHH